MPTNPKTRYKNWHWGIPSTKVVKWEDPDYPDELIEIGRLAELHFKRSKAAPSQIINVSREYINRSHVAFDANHKAQRIYLYTPTEVRRAALRAFWNPRGQRYSLRELSRMAGGRHADTAQGRNSYPDVEVQPIGICTDITYFTHKKGDDDDKGGSYYIHEFGEESGIRPILAVDAAGRFWVAGGNYTCPNPGITD
jgi:hypothetical protein